MNIGTQALSNLKTEKQAKEFLDTNFPDVSDNVVNLSDFVSAPINSLWSVKCDRYDNNGRVVLIGDAAHTILPFLGQGMNLALEDAHILSAILKKYAIIRIAEALTNPFSAGIKTRKIFQTVYQSSLKRVNPTRMPSRLCQRRTSENLVRASNLDRFKCERKSNSLFIDLWYEI